MKDFPSFPVRSNSTSPLLPSSASPDRSSNLANQIYSPHQYLKPRDAATCWRFVRWTCVVLATIGLLRSYAPRRQVKEGFAAGDLKEASCTYEEQGASGWNTSIASQPLRISIRPSTSLSPAKDANPNATRHSGDIYQDALHPQLSLSPILFPTNSSLPVNSSSPSNLAATECGAPVAEHLVEMIPARSINTSDPHLFFSYCTTPTRAVIFGKTWTNFLSAPKNQGSGDDVTAKPPGCLIVDASETGGVWSRPDVSKKLRGLGTTCVMKESSSAGMRYEMRVLSLVPDAWKEAERRTMEENAPPVDWFVIGDDDSWFVSLGQLKDALSQYDPTEDHFLGGFTESIDHLKQFGTIAYGGAGIIISRSLMQKMYGLFDTCAEKFEPVVWGGDGLLTHCASLASGVPLDKVVEEVPGLSQMDLRGDASGFISAGTPLLSLHHWASWLDLLPNRTGVDAITLFSEGSAAIGGQNMFRRWVFDGGKSVWTAGYSIKLHQVPLSKEELAKVEHTWTGYLPRRPSRPARNGARTYFITSVERKSADVTIFHHFCSDPSVPPHLRRIDIIWDARRVRLV